MTMWFGGFGMWMICIGVFILGLSMLMRSLGY
jgi:hypothetical protein